MSIKGLNPYLNFNGTADEAIKLYESALGAKVEALSRFSEIPGMDIAPEYKERVMHCALRLGPATIMISDTMPEHPYTPGTNMHVALQFDDSAEMSAKFDALAAGGTVSMPITDAFWGAKFGMLTDAYGIRWMFNCELKKG